MRIITDSRGQRWDVSADGDGLVFRHQGGREMRGSAPAPLEALSTEDLLLALDEARERAGLDPVGHGEIDVALDPDGYETGR